MLGRLTGSKIGTHATPDECLPHLRELIEGTDIEEMLRKGGEQGIGSGDASLIADGNARNKVRKFLNVLHVCSQENQWG